MNTENMLGLAGFGIACLAAASSGAVFKPGDWYESLAKPWWRPPNWLFPIAWSLLYACIAASGWLVWKKAGFAGAGPALAVYAVQLLFNAAWSGLFFGMHRIDLAFGELVLLWLSIVAVVVMFAPFSSLAAALLLPYLVWVTFAGALNLSMWQLNRASG